jgi:hypothetical protein
MVISNICSQIDLVPTVLSEMGLDVNQFTFSKNILDTMQRPFAFYAFNDGFALLTPTDTVVVDAKPNQLLQGNSDALNHQAHAFMQSIMESIELLQD